MLDGPSSELRFLTPKLGVLGLKADFLSSVLDIPAANVNVY